MGRKREKALAALRRLLNTLPSSDRVPLQPRDRTCDGKTRYGPTTAIKVAAHRSQVSGHTIVPYNCHYCRAWHIGHRINRRDHGP